MATYPATVEQPTATEPSDKSDSKARARYLEAIERYDRGSQEWKERCEKIVRIYLDQHRQQSSPRRFALLWSNIETLKPAVYARLPVAVVGRRFKDADPAGRKASEVLERCINTTFDLYGLDAVMQLVRDDRLLCARGTAWLRYEAELEGDKKTGEHVCVDYVHWCDFGHSLNRTWPEVTMVWRRVYMTREKVEGRWGEDKADKLNYEVRPEYAQRYGSTSDKDATEPQAIIYEIWDKETKQACWLAKEEKIELETGEPPLKFRDYFPCPRPSYGTLSTGSLLPTPDYRYYQDQAEEIDDLTQKIADLTGWLRLKGFYAGGPSSEGTAAIQELLTLEGNQVLVKVESWAGFAERGGVKGLIEWMPLDVITVALREAIQSRAQLIQDVYQITGISDILRGETDPSETLGAQQLKAQTGSRRQATLQRDIARFARDIAEMVGEVIAEQFDPQTMSEMSGLDLTTEPSPEMAMQARQLIAQVNQPQQQPPMPGAPPQQPAQPDPQAQKALEGLQQQLQQYKTNQEVIQLLRDEKTRSFRIEIETDSTIEPDANAEKQSRMEFLGAVGEFMTKVQPAVQAMPALAPLTGEMLLFMVRGFRAGRSMEDLVEKTMKDLTQQAQQPRVDPEQQKAEAELKQKAEQHRQTMEQNQQQFMQKMIQDKAVADQKLEQGQIEMNFKREESQLNRADRAQEFAQKKQEHDDNKLMAAEQHQQKMAQAGDQHKQALDEKRTDAEANRELERDKIVAPKVLQQQKDDLAEFAKALEQIGAVLGDIKEEMAAPVKIMRDKAGRAAGVTKGKRTMAVQRGPDGKATGLH